MATVRDRINGFLNPPQKTTVQQKTKKTSPAEMPGFAGTRARVSDPGGGGNDLGGFDTITSGLDQDRLWRSLNLDDRTFDRMSSAELIKLMIDLSPDISAALWYFVRFCNPGWDVMVKIPGTEDQNEFGQEALEAFFDLLTENHGAVDTVYNAIFLSGFVTGGLCSELVINNAGTEPIDLVAIDGAVIEFKQVKDIERGTIWQPGQEIDNEWVSFDIPTIGYIGIDPLPGERKGRPVATAGLFSSLFLLSLLHDLRRVIAQQGYPRIDLSIDLDALRDAMPEDIDDDPTAVKKWVDDTVNQVAAVYAQLKPDDAYVHTNVVNVNGAVGAVDARSLGAVDGIIRALERMIVRGIKTMPLLMGSNESTSESHANRQWEIYVAGVKAFQHLVEQLLERLFEESLRVLGVQSEVSFKFAELRASEELRDAQTEAIKISNERQKYEMGYTTLDEGALAITGHEADQEVPRVIDLAGGTDLIAAEIAEGGLTDPANATGEQPVSTEATLDGEETGDQGEDRAIIITSDGRRFVGRWINGEDREARVIDLDDVPTLARLAQPANGNGKSATGVGVSADTVEIGDRNLTGTSWNREGVPVTKTGLKEPSEDQEMLAEFRNARRNLEAIVEALTN